MTIGDDIVVLGIGDVEIALTIQGQTCWLGEVESRRCVVEIGLKVRLAKDQVGTATIGTGGAVGPTEYAGILHISHKETATLRVDDQTGWAKKRVGFGGGKRAVIGGESPLSQEIIRQIVGGLRFIDGEQGRLRQTAPRRRIAHSDRELTAGNHLRGANRDADES